MEIADTLNLSQSMVSRMRTGNRSASLETLQAISRHYHVSIEVLASAASKAASGDVRDWVELLARVFDDGELDPDVALAQARA